MNRSWLFVPGDSEKMLGKAAGLDTDALVFDLEDAVAAPRKAAARALLAAHLRDTPRGPAQRWVRVNTADSGEQQADLRAVMAGAPDGIVLPKAEHGDAARDLARELDTLEAEHGLAPGSTRVALIAFESPLAVLNAASYGALHPRVAALSWGAEDMAAGIGAPASRGADREYLSPFRLARDLCLMAAGAAGVQAVDTAYIDYRDADGLARSCAEAARLGFTAKLAIHPGQLAAIHAAFTPDAAAVEQAQAVVEAFAAQPGAGTVGLDGRMLDRPHLLQAERVLALARRG